ncbi:MAG: hypothetical protein WD894_25710 [Pirellulales bacterium]
MHRVSLDSASRSVREFFKKLPIDLDGVEIEAAGKVLCKVIPSHQLSDAEKQCLIDRARELMRRSQERNKGVPARVIEREIRDAIDEVRGRKR